MTTAPRKRVVIVGGGFVGIQCAKGLGNSSVDVLLVDRRNHHLFQPLLYQVAMAGLSPADIAAPIRSMLSRYANVRVLQGEALEVDWTGLELVTDFGREKFDYLILACGARPSYFGHDAWSEVAPGLKTIEDATEIRRRVLQAFEEAERNPDPKERRKQLTFVIIGGGPTGVELAGAIGEMTRFTLARDFRTIDAKSARIMLIEAGPRILPMFSAAQSDRATRDLEGLGVQVWSSSSVSEIDREGVQIGSERICAATVLWAAGVKAARIASRLGFPTDKSGRVLVEADLSLAGHPNVFVAGDMAHFQQEGRPLPGVAPVATQQGRFLARTILAELRGRNRKNFRYADKGQMATIGRSRAIVEVGHWHIAGRLAWWIWLVVHIYYLTGFSNRMLVVMQWAWSYFTFRRGARLIVGAEKVSGTNGTAIGPK